MVGFSAADTLYAGEGGSKVAQLKWGSIHKNPKIDFSPISQTPARRGRDIVFQVNGTYFKGMAYWLWERVRESRCNHIFE